MHRKLWIGALMLTTAAAFAQSKKVKKASTAVAAEWKDTAKSNYRIPGSPLPPLRVVTSDGKVITDKDVANDANLFVMLFNPTCEHCENVTLELEKNVDLFKNSHILLVSASSMMPHLSYFENTTHYSQYPKLKVGVDSSFLVERTFAYQSLPQINIYDKNRKLIRYYTGEVSIDTLKQYIQ